MLRTFQAAMRWATRSRRQLKRFRKRHQPKPLVLTVEQQRMCAIAWQELVNKAKAHAQRH